MELSNLEVMQRNLEKLREYYRPYATGTSSDQISQMEARIIAALLSTMITVNEIATKLQEGDKV